MHLPGCVFRPANPPTPAPLPSTRDRSGHGRPSLPRLIGAGSRSFSTLPPTWQPPSTRRWTGRVRTAIAPVLIARFRLKRVFVRGGGPHGARLDRRRWPKTPPIQTLPNCFPAGRNALPTRPPDSEPPERIRFLKAFVVEIGPGLGSWRPPKPPRTLPGDFEECS
jgi:hypothetical protein